MGMPPQGGWQPQGQGDGPHWNPQPGGPQPFPGQHQPYPGQYPPDSRRSGNWGPPSGGNGRWLLVAIAILLIVGVSIGATILFTRDGEGSPSGPETSGTASDVRSADDTGPIAILTDDPTCTAFTGINNGLADVQGSGWGDQRAVLGPRDEWTPEQLAQVESVATAMRNAADRVVALTKQTPHRLMRELYEQFIAYGRAYADSVPQYQPQNDGLASANVNATSMIVGICKAISNGAAGEALAVAAADPPTALAGIDDPAALSTFIESPEPSCSTFKRLSDQFNQNTVDWQAVDTNLDASQWTPEQRAAHQRALPYFSSWATDLETAGRGSGNPVLEDFAVAASLYLRSFVATGDNYSSADSWLSYVGFKSNQLILGACRAVGAA